MTYLILLFNYFVFNTTVSSSSVENASLAGTTWRLVQCNYENKLRNVDHRATLTFAEDLNEMVGNDGCSDIVCDMSLQSNQLSVVRITSPAKKTCVGEKKLKIAKVFITTLRNDPVFKVSGNYLMLYTGGVARLVFAKIITEGEDETIIRRSYKVDAIYYKKGETRYMKLYDFVTQSNIFLQNISGFTYVPGYFYNIEMETVIKGEGSGAKKSYKLLKVVSKVKK